MCIAMHPPSLVYSLMKLFIKFTVVFDNLNTPDAGAFES